MIPTHPDSADDDLLASMRRHDDLAPDGGQLAEQVLARAGHEHEAGPRRRVPLGVAAAVVSVAAILATSYALTRDTAGDRVAVPLPTASPSGVPAAPKDPTPSLLDPLTYRLTLTEPRPNGIVGSRITVTNGSDRLVVDPACRHSANFDYGVVPVDRPGAPLRAAVITRCGAPQDLPPGFRSTFAGPRFVVRGLPPGDYLAAIDFGDARSERLSVPLTVPGPR